MWILHGVSVPLAFAVIAGKEINFVYVQYIVWLCSFWVELSLPPPTKGNTCKEGNEHWLYTIENECMLC